MRDASRCGKGTTRIGGGGDASTRRLESAGVALENGFFGGNEVGGDFENEIENEWVCDTHEGSTNDPEQAGWEVFWAAITLTLALCGWEWV